jgi:hypothetical protein
LSLPYWVDAQVINNYITGLDDEKNIKGPEYFQLQQNYPNPFNPSTRITYSIPQRSYISLKVYDVLGNEVAILIDEEKLAGEYEVVFVASGLSSGIYYYQLISGGNIETRKMLLIR